MNLNVLPHKIALMSATCAFGAAWLVGIACKVSIDVISLRAVLAAAAFWFMGIMAGRMVVNSICDAITERIQAANRAGAKAGDK